LALEATRVIKLTKNPLRQTHRFSEEMIQECLLIMQSGDIEDLFGIIPRIGVLRDERFYDHLTELLSHEDLKRREFAAYAMGAIGDRVFLEQLKRAFLESQKLKDFAVEDFQLAAIEAIGALGDDAAADFFRPVLKKSGGSSRDRRMRSRIVESLGAVAQQGGSRSLEVLLEVTGHKDPELRAQSISELSVAYWHRPRDVADSTLDRIFELTRDRNAVVAESALAALQSLADVGCQRAEKYFSEENLEDPDL
jgi:HEAT repeat protein